MRLRGDGPLDATVIGTYFTACLVANLALNDGPRAASREKTCPICPMLFLKGLVRPP